MTDIKLFSVTMIMTNCYLITDKDTGDMAVVDPGERSDALIDEINSADGELKYVILTHGHYDHIGYAKPLADLYGAKIVCGKLTDKFLGDNMLNHSAFHEKFNFEPFSADILLDDGDKFSLGNTEFTYMSTPGHTSDSGCYIFDDIILTGDTVFCETYGRTDLPTGSFQDIVQSMKKLAKLSGEYNLLPGHGMMTTLSHERKYNPLMSRV